MSGTPYIDHPLTLEEFTEDGSTHRVLDMNADLVAVVYGATLTDGETLGRLLVAAPALLAALAETKDYLIAAGDCVTPDELFDFLTNSIEDVIGGLEEVVAKAVKA